MTRPELFENATGGNKEAVQFLSATYEHFDTMHEFVKSGSKDVHKFIALMANTNKVFSLPFYVKHADALHTAVLRVVNFLDDEVALSLVFDVALLLLGFERARKLLVELEGKE